MITREEMTALVMPVLAAHEMELVELQIAPGRRHVVRVFIDSVAGIKVGDCAQISREIARKLDAMATSGEYVLEVSSPGMNRPIWSREHFQRFRGEKLSFETKEAHEGQVRFTGTIDSVEGDLIRLRIAQGEIMELTVEEIACACLDMDPWRPARG